MAAPAFVQQNPIRAAASALAGFIYSGTAPSWFGGSVSWSGGSGASVDWGSWRGIRRMDYGAAVGTGLGNSALLGCFRVLSSGVSEPPLQMYSRGTTPGKDKPIPHPLTDLLMRPHPFLPWELLSVWMGWSLHADGNCYFFKRRDANGRGKPVILEPMVPTMVRPMWPNDGSEFISHYQYSPDNSTPRDLKTEDVLHIRLNIDPENTRKGRSPLRSVYRQIYTDEEADSFTAALLTNMAIPGLLMSPDPKSVSQPDKEEAEKIKAEAEQKFGGDNRGRTMVTQDSMVAQQVGFSPEQMNLSKLRYVPESRICSVLGVPPILAHLAVGLEYATYNNVAELREHFTEATLIPLWRLIASQIAHSLLPDFERDTTKFVLRYDLTDVRALQEDEDAKYKRLEGFVRAGIIKVIDAQRDIGLPGDPAADVYYVPINVQALSSHGLEMLAGESEAPPAPVPPQLANVQPASGDTNQPQLPPPADQTQEAAPATPAAKARKAAAMDALYIRSLQRHRRTRTASFESEVSRYFAGLAGRAEQRYLNATKRAAVDVEALQAEFTRLTKATDDTAQLALDATTLIPPSEEKPLRDLMKRNAVAVGESTYNLASDRLGIDVAFELDNPLVVAYLENSGRNVRGILEETRRALSAALQEEIEAGESVQAAAARVREVVTESYRNRSLAIARTEVGTAQNQAANNSYRSAGVVARVKVYDGTDFDDPCREANGQEWTFQEADARLLEHPNCTRAFAPVVE